LANAGAKPGSLFTRNNDSNKNQRALQKLTSFDENVCVNQIRETAVVHQKFVKNGSEVATRFSARKNYGSVCVVPQSYKNKPLFFSVVENKANVQTSH